MTCHAVRSALQERVILQFGKVGDDLFTMDYAYPMTAMQASEGAVGLVGWLLPRMWVAAGFGRFPALCLLGLPHDRHAGESGAVRWGLLGWLVPQQWVGWVAARTTEPCACRCACRRWEHSQARPGELGGHPAEGRRLL